MGVTTALPFLDLPPQLFAEWHVEPAELAAYSTGSRFWRRLIQTLPEVEFDENGHYLARKACGPVWDATHGYMFELGVEQGTDGARICLRFS